MSDAKVRAIALILYFFALLIVQHVVIDSGLTPNENAIWLYGGLASLLFGSRILNPYFTPPSGALINAVTAFLALVAAIPIIPASTLDATVLKLAVSYCAGVALISILLLISRPPLGEEPGWLWRLFERAVAGLGSPNCIFGVVIVSAVWLFHRDAPQEVFAILTVFITIAVLQPLEALGRYFQWFLDNPKPIARDDLIGSIAAYQSPGIVLVRQVEPRTVTQGTPMIIADQHGPPLLGVALNYVGRDEGNLLRVLTTKLPQRLAASLGLGPSNSNGMAFPIVMTDEDKAHDRTLQLVDRLCGIVDTDTSPAYLQFEVVSDSKLSEGSLVEVRIGEDRQVIYQVVDGATRDEIVQQKNKYGYARAQARKIGTWDAGARRFRPIPWMPRINAPVFLLERQEDGPADDCVGHFPGTPFGVRFDPSEAVTHNTAILGILGVGKSYLAIELVERMIAQGVKVLCLDLTNQYQLLLSEFLDTPYEELKRNELAEAGKNSEPHKNRELGGSRNDFKKAVLAQMKEFLSPDDDHFLRVLNPASFRVTKQVSFLDKNGEAELTRLTASEITSIFSDAALIACQDLGMTDSARLCLVYEEAHSLVPEWNSVAAEGDKLATATSARAILQGRKFGLGCLLITQRTANVTKTILNQCNTIFAMRTFDDTGKDFLGNYIGSDYASMLPSMQARHAIVFGKASSCENPVLIRLNDQNRFRERFRQDHAPRRPTPMPPPGAHVDAGQPDGNGE